MVSALLFDFSWVLIFPTDPSYAGEINPLHRRLSQRKGYRLFDHFRLNEELIAYCRNLKGRVGLYIFTAGTIQESPELKERLAPVFDDIFSATALGVSKRQPDAYRSVATMIGKEPGELLFIDDYLDYLRAAKAAGLQTLRFETNEQIFHELKQFIDPPSLRGGE